MSTGYVMIGSAILLVLLLFTVSKLLVKGRLVSNSEDMPGRNTAGAAFAVPTANSKWWLQSDKATQLQIAIVLTEKSLPVWEGYISSGPVSYIDKSSLLSKTIDTNLLGISLMEIKAATFSNDSNHQRINDCYKRFVAPVLALQDGDWIPPYAVKKIFLSCFNILKGIIEKNRFDDNGNYFVVAIDHSLDCIDIAKLYDGVQVDDILSAYRLAM